MKCISGAPSIASTKGTSRPRLLLASKGRRRGRGVWDKWTIRRALAHASDCGSSTVSQRRETSPRLLVSGCAVDDRSRIGFQALFQGILVARRWVVEALHLDRVHQLRPLR